MPPAPKATSPFNLLIVSQGGRLQYEALMFTAALRACAPDLLPRLYIAEPQPGPLWPDDPRMSTAVRDWLTGAGAKVVPLHNRHFGAAYPHGNKIEALALLPPATPFVFFDTDTLLLQSPAGLASAFTRPAASLKVQGTWPEPQPYVATLNAIWSDLYARFGLDITPTRHPDWPADDWRHYLYFNAGWFCGPCPQQFGDLFTRYATEVRDAPGDMLAAQSLDPWLDQAVLPLVIHALGGGRPGAALVGLDGDISCHYRHLPLLYARESDAVIETLERVCDDKPLRRLLRDYEPARKLIYQTHGRRKIRPMFDRTDPALHEGAIRKALRQAGWWFSK